MFALFPHPNAPTLSSNLLLPKWVHHRKRLFDLFYLQESFEDDKKTFIRYTSAPCNCLQFWSRFSPFNHTHEWPSNGIYLERDSEKRSTNNEGIKSINDFINLFFFLVPVWWFYPEQWRSFDSCRLWVRLMNQLDHGVLNNGLWKVFKGRNTRWKFCSYLLPSHSQQ